MIEKNAKHYKIFIVDDHPVFRYGLSQLINQEKGMEVCGEADTAIKALKMIKECKPDLVIVDISLAHSSGLELTKDIVAYDKNLPVLIISMHDERLYAERVLRYGARGYVMKQNTYETVITAIRKVLSGGIFVSQDIAETIITQLIDNSARKSTSQLSNLSDREFDILRMIGEGKSIKEISSILNLSVNTINTYRERIKTKLNIKNHLELEKFAFHLILNNKEI